MGTRMCRNKGPTLALPSFLHALGPHETLAFLFFQNNLNPLNSGLIFRNQPILKRVDAALGSLKLSGHSPNGTADLGPRAEYLACFDPSGPKLVENSADTGGAVRKRQRFNSHRDERQRDSHDAADLD